MSGQPQRKAFVSSEHQPIAQSVNITNRVTQREPECCTFNVAHVIAIGIAVTISDD